MQYTLAQLRARVAKAADVEFAAGERHTPDDAANAINDALAEYWLVLTDCGHPQSSVRGSATTSSSATESDGWPDNQHVVIGTDCLAVLGVWRLDDGQRYPLEPFTGHDQVHLLESGRPSRYQLTRNSQSEVIIRLLPPADGAYTIEWLVVPEPDALAQDSDPVELIVGTVDYVVSQAALTLLRADGVPEGQQFSALAAQRDMCEAKLRRYAARLNRAGGGTRRDTRGRTAEYVRWDRFYGRGL